MTNCFSASLFLLLVGALCLVQGQVPFSGKCPSVDVQRNFNVTKYLGKWYEAEKFFAIFEMGGKCNFAIYSLFDNGTVNVHNEQTQKSSGGQHFIEGNARFAGSSDEGKLLVSFPSVGQKDGPYWILETDYDNYSVVWSCGELPMMSQMSAKFAWILTRERNPSSEIISKAYDVFDRLNLSRKDLTKTEQTDC